MDWASARFCKTHKRKQLFLSVYVDDFKCSGNADSLKGIWKLLNKHMELEDPISIHKNVYLGCEQSNVDIPQAMIKDKKDFFNGILKSIENNPDKTDISDENIQAQGNLLQEPNLQTNTSAPSKPAAKVRGYEYKMKGHAEQTVERYLELSGKKLENLKPVATPCMDDHLFPPEELVEKGHLAPVAARIVLKALYLARLARPEILWTVNYLAREVTRWTVACDKRLLRPSPYLLHPLAQRRRPYVLCGRSTRRLLLGSFFRRILCG